ncbi:3-hydroxyacyl-CoA dehydrogenase [Olsenella massiliensis]|uniref:3-hydroxyacyl-CoA dehydrogenase n=1 Tax=Olsenella massiliensis TaxID=1622075 RepID=UPI00071E6890|nr:3-hydroxyacyl-CoA dehydrogenase [Olsenella massiliensis]
MGFSNITVAGGGILGSQIAFQSAYQGFNVTIWLRSEASVGRARPKIDRLRTIYLDTLEAMKTDPAAYAYGLLAKEDVTPEACDAAKESVEAAYANLRLTTSWDEAFGDADLVIEAVAEDPKAKTDFYTELARHLPQKTVVVTNSSTLLPSSFAAATGRPEKFLALHFANEIWRNPTGEVMAHAGTDKAHFEEVVEFTAAIRMIPLRVLKEQPGYLLNSMLVPLLSAAQYLWANGVGSVEDIDRAWTLGTGAPAGPFRILDVVGLVTAYNIASMNPKAKDPSTVEHRIVKLLKEKIDAGETGVNAGKGFYEYHA